ncbi:MAG TPA: hypothetical protein VHO47_05000 [Candidatus Babeliales bacterium]|nr:hypothetical protein [Candidatus Babeliales bacterium]
MKIQKLMLIALSITLAIPVAQASWRSYGPAANNTPATGRAALGSYRSSANYSNPTNGNYWQTGDYNDKYNAEGYYGNKPFANNSTQPTGYNPSRYRQGVVNTNTQTGVSGAINRNLNW